MKDWPDAGSIRPAYQFTAYCTSAHSLPSMQDVLTSYPAVPLAGKSANIPSLDICPIYCMNALGIRLSMLTHSVLILFRASLDEDGLRFATLLQLPMQQVLR